MRKQTRKKDNSLTIHFKLVTAIMLGMIILLSIYIYSNYVVAAPVLHLPDAFQSGVDSRNPSQTVPTLKETHTSTQKSPGQNPE
ncbi:hypothetical protein [Pantoea vagans]|uniref:hypothetical protein n=1 Tax=Pantoea vagans TaxID=470934 RepID=UPI000F4E5769|nr:hypothetical protein [Pantoea vagans]